MAVDILDLQSTRGALRLLATWRGGAEHRSDYWNERTGWTSSSRKRS